MNVANADILLVEDNAADAELALESLRSESLAGGVCHVHDGVEALDYMFGRGAYASRAVAARPHIILLDIKLPRVDGFGVLRELKADPRTRLTPIVMLTSSIVERDVALCYRLGASSYVQKPVDFEQFRTTVRAVARYWLRVSAAVPARAFTERAP